MILTDSKKRKEAKFFLEAAKNFTRQIRLIEIPLGSQSGEEPPAEVLKPLFWADIALLVTSHSLSHTEARRKAALKGARIASLPTITFDIIKRTLDTDYRGLAITTDKIAKILSEGEEVRILSENGTDLKMSIKGRKAVSDSGLFLKPGTLGNLPAGEAFIAPLEKTAGGVAVIDGNAFLPGVFLDEPIRIFFRWGRVRKIKGGRAANILKETLAKANPNAKKLGELGVGTNPQASLSTALLSPLEVEKVLGTVHLGLGSNFTFGGRVKASFHYDGVILRPTLKVDGKTIVQGGKLCA